MAYDRNSTVRSNSDWTVKILKGKSELAGRVKEVGTHWSLSLSLQFLQGIWGWGLKKKTKQNKKRTLKCRVCWLTQVSKIVAGTLEVLNKRQVNVWMKNISLLDASYWLLKQRVECVCDSRLPVGCTGKTRRRKASQLRTSYWKT